MRLAKKGKYRFEHRLDGDQHLIVLTSVDRKETPVRVYELRTTTLASKAIAKKTEIVARELTAHSLQIALVSVAGEAFEHLPATVPLSTN